MIKPFLMILGFLVMFSLWTGALQARFGSLDIQQSKIPIVVELYTSEGCSSCPPADRVLEELAQYDNVITLGCHVTYWDRLGWTDTLGRSFCDARQRTYARQRNSSRVYTPQMVVNGKHEFVGSHKGDASKYVQREVKAKDIKAVVIKNQGDRFYVRLPSVTEGDYELWVVGYKQDHTTQIGRGENHGRNVRYVNTALTLDGVGEWSGETKTLSIDKPGDAEIDGIAIIAQSRTHGPIVAAGRYKF